MSLTSASCLTVTSTVMVCQQQCLLVAFGWADPLGNIHTSLGCAIHKCSVSWLSCVAAGRGIMLLVEGWTIYSNMTIILLLLIVLFWSICFCSCLLQRQNILSLCEVLLFYVVCLAAELKRQDKAWLNLHLDSPELALYFAKSYEDKMKCPLYLLSLSFTVSLTHIFVTMSKWEKFPHSESIHSWWLSIMWTCNDHSHISYPFCLLLFVSLLVEVWEEEVEHDSMEANPPDKGLWVVAVNKKQLEGMDHHEHKLNLTAS